MNELVRYSNSSYVVSSVVSLSLSCCRVVVFPFTAAEQQHELHHTRADVRLQRECQEEEGVLNSYKLIP